MEKSVKLKIRQKFSSLDIRALISELNKEITGCKINSVFSINQRTYLLRCGKSSRKVDIIIESGTKIVSSTEKVNKQDQPNFFCQQLRKLMNGFYIKEIQQVGVERLVQITLRGTDSTGNDIIFYLIVELYARGNIVFCDHNYRIVALLRPHIYNDQVKWAINEKYPFQIAAKFYLEKISLSQFDFEEFERNPKATALSALNSILPFCHQSLAEINLLSVEIKPTDKITSSNVETIKKVAQEIFNLYTNKFDGKGYRYFLDGSQKSFEFSPVPLNYNKIFGERIKEVEDTNFQKSLELHFDQHNVKIDLKSEEIKIEEEAMKKFEKIKEDQEKRLIQMREEINTSLDKGFLIEKHCNEIDAIIGVILLDNK